MCLLPVPVRPLEKTTYHATAWLLSVLDQYHVEERGDAET
jgi:hypothetical protein